MSRHRRSIVTLVAALAGVLALGSRAASAGRPLANDRCPVMREEFATPTHEVQFHGKAVRFCCEDCRERFARGPGRYLARLPQFAPEEASAIVSALQRAGKPDELNSSWAERWSQPLMLGAATLIALWLALRVTRRLRSHADSAHSIARAGMHPGQLPPGQTS